MMKNRFHSLAIVTLLIVAGSWQYSSAQAAMQRSGRDAAAPNARAESFDPDLTPAKTKGYKFRSIDVPGAYTSQLFDYNGEIAVGFSNDKTSSYDSAFFFESDVYKAIVAPGSATDSQAYGVNASGHMVGSYVDVLAVMHGFVFDGTNFATFDYPGATDTGMFDINDSGDIVGEFSQGANYQGFLFNKNKNTFTALNYPSALFSKAYGVNASDAVVGWYQDTDNNRHGFLWKSGIYSSLNVPGAAATYATGINDSDLIVGAYSEGGAYHGFIFDGTNFTKVDVPNGMATILWKVKNNKTIVGTVTDAAGAYHGVIGR